MKRAVFKEFNPVADLSLQRQISNFLREAVSVGKLKPGDRIPTLRDLADAWNTNYFTVNAAIKTLVHEGVMSRKPRVGTFVKSQSSIQLDKVGIYFKQKMFASNEDAYYMALLHSLQEQLSQRGAQNITFWDEREETEQTEAMPEIRNAIGDGRINCLIAPLVGPYAIQALRKLSVPRVALTNTGDPFVVKSDAKHAIDEIMVRFGELGVRKIGILNNAMGLTSSDGSPNYTAIFKQSASEANLECRDEWVLTPSVPANSIAQFGYEAFKAFWQQEGDKPEALLVATDTVAMGCVNAILELGVKVPEQLKIIIHRNQEVDFFVPFPVDWIVTSAEEAATLLVEKLEAQMQGKTVVQPRQVGYRLVRNVVSDK
jgi:DNA-binding LacI/PurR family transcriptional regulator